MVMHTYECKLIKVIDADTIDVYIDLGFQIRVKKRIRMLGVNAPETRTKDLIEKEKGLAAKKYLKTTLKDVSNLVIATEKDNTGKYGRILGTVFADSVNINELLIDEGHAERYLIQLEV